MRRIFLRSTFCFSQFHNWRAIMNLRFTTFLLLLSFVAFAHGGLRVKRSSARACREGEAVWSEDCNTCLCFKGRVFCTKYECHGPPNFQNRIEDIEEQCESGTRWKVGCQTCFCTVEGVPKCTNYRCEGVESLFRKKREFISDRKKPETTQFCQPGFSTHDGCNTITCTDTGHAMTTLMLCSNHDFNKKVPLCEEGATWKLKGYECVCKNGNGDCKLEKSEIKKRSLRPDIGKTKFCQPGYSWHDGCNQQGCSEDGSYYSTAKACPPSMINENVAICEKDSTWEHKGKKCHCTEKGFGECQVAKKRSVRATVVDDSAEEKENRRRKQQGLPQRFCQPNFTWFDGCGHFQCDEISQVIHVRGDCDGGDDDPKRNKKAARCAEGKKWTYPKSSLKCECKNGIGECKS